METYIIIIVVAAVVAVLIGSYYVIKKQHKSVKLNDWKDGDKSGQC